MSKRAYESFGPVWERHAFDEDTGGYVVVHRDHERDNLASELRVAEVFMREGRAVRLLSERGPKGEKRLDAQVDDERWDFKEMRATHLGRTVNPRSSMTGAIDRAMKQRAEYLAIEINNSEAEEDELFAAAARKLRYSRRGTLKAIRLIFLSGRVTTRTRDQILYADR